MGDFLTHKYLTAAEFDLLCPPTPPQLEPPALPPLRAFFHDKYHRAGGRGFSRLYHLLVDNADKEGIVRDMEEYAVRWARSQGFSGDKVCCLVGIVSELFFRCMAGLDNLKIPVNTDKGERLVDKDIQLEEAWAMYTELMRKHSVHRPPHSIQVFSINDVQAINAWMLETFFRHYRLYKYVYTKRHELHIELAQDIMETPPVPPALALFSAKPPTPVSSPQQNQENGNLLNNMNATSMNASLHTTTLVQSREILPPSIETDHVDSDEIIFNDTEISLLSSLSPSLRVSLTSLLTLQLRAAKQEMMEKIERINEENRRKLDEEREKREANNVVKNKKK